MFFSLTIKKSTINVDIDVDDKLAIISVSKIMGFRTAGTVPPASFAQLTFRMSNRILFIHRVGFFWVFLRFLFVYQGRSDCCLFWRLEWEEISA